MRVFLGLATGLSCLPALVSGDTGVPRMGAHGLSLPATFTGTLPCADCPGIAYHLDLWDSEQGYALRRVYLERDLTVDEVGRWHVDPERRALILEGSGGAQSQWQISNNQDLRLMDQEGQPIVSDLPYTLEAGPLAPTDLSLPVSGLMTYFADAAVLRECLTGQSFPIAMEGEYLDLERAYLEAQPAPGAPLLVRIDATIEMRAQMEGPDRRTVVVNAFHHVTPDAGCPDHRHAPDLENTFWGITHLEGAALEPEEGQRDPYLLILEGGTRFSGTIGCNMMMGSLSRSENEVEFGPVASTMMACPDPLQALEAQLAAAVQETVRIDLEGGILRLLDANRVERARLSARYVRY